MRLNSVIIKKMKQFYITTTLPYVNSDPHVGFAMEVIRADVIARFHSLLGEEVIFNTGTDEHGQKIYQNAVEAGEEPQSYVDKYAVKFEGLKEALNLSYTHFIRTTDEKHIRAAQEFWQRVDKNGYIYKGRYQVKYCVGCELEKQDSELEDGRCPIHPNKEIELIDEENYFFKFSAFEEKLKKLYKDNPTFVVPENRLREIENFVETGLRDFSISRLKEKLPWGVSVPGDEKQVFYVWFDALVSYISTLGWPEDEKNFEKWWPGVQICGKDNLRQQTAMWQAMLLAAELPPSKQILVNGFIMADGQKMSKSLGNVVDPFEYVDRCGTDALRYYLLSQIRGFEDGDFTREKFEEVYTADLTNGLGNLVARVAGLAGSSEFTSLSENLTISEGVAKALEEYQFDRALELIWKEIKLADQLINEKEVWKLEDEEKQKVLEELVELVRSIAVNLQPFLPQTAERILGQYKGSEIRKQEGLFPRLS